MRQWIEAGAPWGDAATAKEWNYREEDLWPFRPLPERSPLRSIDSFINEKLQGRGLPPAPRADRRTLIRRATIDLTGLPPTPEEVEAFVNDAAIDAWPKVIERLLSSPRYGERWGRHWLDVVRYADTNGYSNDFERPNAWRYRDYVIRSFNRDKPYDQFIREQIAGDELAPNDREALIATGFLRAGPWEHTVMSVEAVTRQMFLDDVTHATATTFLSLTLGCARCHDHKFDPLPTRDYYRMQAIFATTEFARPPVSLLQEENASQFAPAKSYFEEIVRRLKAHADLVDERVKQHLMRERGVSRIDEVPKEELEKALRNKPGLSEAEREEARRFQRQSPLYRGALERFEPKAFSVSSGPLDGFTDGGPKLKYPMRADYKTPEVRILAGGNLSSAGAAVTPGLLSALERYGNYPAPEIPQTVSGRRTALSNWIANPKNPLTPRVMVNRIWQWHFGKGIAADSNNFGKMGKKPTHPELLDWLAANFIEQGWSVKAIHRAIMLSEVYQRASNHPQMEALKNQDPNNELLAYYSPQRMEAEVLRDSILFVSGELSLDAGGPGTFPQINEDVARQPLQRMGSSSPAYHYQASAKKRDRNRRTIYTFQERSLVDPMIDVFDGPSLDLSCERRRASTVPTQAFALFNSQFAHDMALAFAVRLEREESSTQDRLARAFRLVYGRAPDQREIAMAIEHLQRLEQLHRTVPAPPKPKPTPLVPRISSVPAGATNATEQQEDAAIAYEENLHPSQVRPETRALADMALVLLNSNEFVYIY